ncbi:permease often clustered with de novo purine synthesis [Rhodopirellula islandica]|uniref:Permease often clustered with de novo purine synthesis n=1 Tax=Rhodopirellula islandica TaxID=595434 RepID=A0A0J1BHK0_RHOIS|nr:AI-2E family transporter [Rhodopirellula islandica]KLU06007.1 permease often clustered with de novo purine synthesis [Rhodopirellula islandica]
MDDTGFARRVLIASGITLLVVAVAALFYVARNLVPLIFGAILIAVVLNQLATVLGRLVPASLSHTARVGWVISAVALLSCVMLYSFANSAVDKATQFKDRIESSVQESFESFKTQPLVEDHLKDDAKLSSMMPSSGKSIGLAKNFFTSAFGGMADFLILLILSIYFAISPDKYRVGAIRLLPTGWRDKTSDLLSDSSTTLWRWMIGRLIAMALVGIVFGIGLAVIGVPMPLELGVFAGLVTFIPNIGGIAAVVPALLLASQEGTTALISVLVLYLVIQTIESYLITPMVQEHQVELPPAMVILAQIVGGLVFGFWGIVFATPMFAVSMLWIKQVYVEDWLES